MSQPEERTWQLSQIRAPQAWDTTTGAGITVGIVDVWTVDNHIDLPAVAKSGAPRPERDPDQ